MTHEQIAWLAGIWDGEGSIGAYLAKNGKQAKDKTTVRVIVQVGMTHEPTMRTVKDFVSDIIGREIRYRVSNDNRGWRPLYRLRTHNLTDVAVLLQALAPFLVTKRQQADLVLRLVALAPGRGGNHRLPWTDEHHKILLELGDLNRRYSKEEWSARLATGNKP